MIEFRIKFDETKTLQNGRIVSEIQEDIQNYFQKYPTTVQISEHVYRDDSEDAMGIFGVLINEICNDDSLFTSLESMSWNIDGVEEDNIQCELEWRAQNKK